MSRRRRDPRFQRARPRWEAASIATCLLAPGPVLMPAGAQSPPSWVEQTFRPRSSLAVAFDSLRGRAVLFGGFDGTNAFSDTWEWNGAEWASRAVNGPSARFGHKMVYDSIRGVTVLFGGSLMTADFSGETWEWNGTAW